MHVVVSIDRTKAVLLLRLFFDFIAFVPFCLVIVLLSFRFLGRAVHCDCGFSRATSYIVKPH